MIVLFNDYYEQKSARQLHDQPFDSDLTPKSNLSVQGIHFTLPGIPETDFFMMATDPTFQLEWKKGTDIPCDITWCRTTTVEQNTFVADYSGSLKVFLYGAESDSWEFLSETVSPSTLFFGLGVFRGHLVLVGGKHVQTTEASKLVTEWRSVDKTYINPYPPMIYPRVDPLVVGWGDYLIVIGGVVAEGKQTVEVFNADKDVSAWKEAGKIPVSSLLSCAVIDNEILYLLGDFNKLFKISLAKLVSSTPAPDSLWEFVVDMPLKESTIFSYQNFLLSVGGYTADGSPVSDVMCLNRQNAKWVKVGDLPHPCLNCCCISVPKHEAIVLMGGKSNLNEPLLLKNVYRSFKPLKK